jgi:hypothetical protein
MIDSPSSIVLSGSNRYGVGSTSMGRCRCSWQIRAWAQIRASVSKMTFLSISTTLPFSLQWVLSSLGPLNILIPSNRGLEIVWALNHLVLRGIESLSN